MKAAIITKPGGPEVLEIREVARPVPGPRQVLVQVRASGLNRADLLQRRGHYPAPQGYPADIGGIEFAGEVAGLGKGAKRWKQGQRVFGVTGGGAHAEFVAVHEDTVSEIPGSLDWAPAGAVPEVFITAHDALFTQAGVKAGEKVLIHAVGSGVGLAAVQLCAAISAIPDGTSRTQDKLERARALGMKEGFSENFSAEAAGETFDVILDLVGGEYMRMSLPLLASKGRLVLLATMGGSKIELDLRQLLSKRLRIMGSVMRARPHEDKVAANEAFARDVLPLLESGKVKPVIDSQFRFAQIAEAHRRLESNETFGKVVLLM
jgi:NADPH2:quinone reductase